MFNQNHRNMVSEVMYGAGTGLFWISILRLYPFNACFNYASIRYPPFPSTVLSALLQYLRPMKLQEVQEELHLRPFRATDHQHVRKLFREVIDTGRESYDCERYPTCSPPSSPLVSQLSPPVGTTRTTLRNPILSCLCSCCLWVHCISVYTFRTRTLRGMGGIRPSSGGVGPSPVVVVSGIHPFLRYEPGWRPE